MKTVFTTAILLTSFFFGATTKKFANTLGFKLTVTTYNHAQMMFNGIMIYNLEGNFLKISRREFMAEKDSVVYWGKISNEALKKIKLFKSDGLSEFYNNKCILTTSGNEYFVALKAGKTSASIHLHHYYQQDIEELFLELNKVIPNEYDIHYVTKDTPQGCE